MENVEIPREVEKSEHLTTELLDDGRVIFTVNNKVLMLSKPDISITEFDNHDNTTSWILEFVLEDRSEGGN